MKYKKANSLRFESSFNKGHYESYFLRANHPTKKQAFWFRYTIFQPQNNPNEAVAELWGAFFDNDKVIAIQEDVDLSRCDLRNSENFLKISDSKIIFLSDGKGTAFGKVKDAKNTMAWQLEYTGSERPLLLLRPKYYDRSLPKAKALSGLPNAHFSGSIEVNGEKFNLENWQGSENHNWGSKHTDEYAWGQVCGFDGSPNSFLECSTARIKLGPLWSPWLNLAVLRIDGVEYRFNGLWQAIKNEGYYDYFQWKLSCRSDDLQLDINFKASANDFAAFHYRNPPGGHHTCLNTKVAGCEITLKKKGKVIHQLSSLQSAAFEILTDDVKHGIEIAN